MAFFSFDKFLGRENKSAQQPLRLSEVNGAQAQMWAWTAPGTPNTTPRGLVTEGYHQNSAVFICTQKLATGYCEPPLKVLRKKNQKWLDEHPLQLLLDRPNDLMSRAELLRFHITYKALGGNGYLYKLRNELRQPLQLWPYSDIEMTPVPGNPAWIAFYAYGNDPETAMAVDRADIVHEKYAVNPLTPYRGIGALHTITREYGTDSELTRYVQALIANDAVPRGILTVKEPGASLGDDARIRIKEEFQRMYSGAKRGKVALLEGLTYERMALHLQELAVDTLRGSDEARIAGAFMVPIEITGLVSSKGKRTYSNYEEARESFVEDTLIPHWRSLEDELNADLVPEFGDDIEVRFDMNGVRALQASMLKRRTFALAAWAQQAISLNELRVELGRDPLPGGDDKFFGGEAPVQPEEDVAEKVDKRPADKEADRNDDDAEEEKEEE